MVNNRCPVQAMIKQDATNAAASHIDTIRQHLLEAIQIAQISGGDVLSVGAAVKDYPKEPALACRTTSTMQEASRPVPERPAERTPPVQDGREPVRSRVRPAPPVASAPPSGRRSCHCWSMSG